MSELNKSLVKQYYSTNLFEEIKSVLLKMNKDLDELTPEDLTPVDFFHIRGPQSTKELAELCKLKPIERILDIGSGIGGTARFLASQYGSYVIGVDVTEEYSKTAAQLSGLLKLGERTEFKVGNAEKLQFEEESFDVVWTENVQMNIKNKNSFYSEIYRVLKRECKFVFHDVFKGNVDKVYYPVPWAEDESISFLTEVNELKQLLKSFSYKISCWTDKTEVSAEAFKKSAEKIKRNGLPPLGLHLLMGENTVEKIENMARNLAEKRLTVIQCICSK